MYSFRIVRLVLSYNRSICKNKFSFLTNSLYSGDTPCLNRQFLFIINKFSTSSSPDDNHNVSKEKNGKKRRRIISSDSSADELDVKNNTNKEEK